MILITNGFSAEGMALLEKLNIENFNNIIISADSNKKSASRMYKIESTIDTLDVTNWLEHNADEVDFVFDISKQTGTSKLIWSACYRNQIPIIFINTDKAFSSWSRQEKNSPFFWKAVSGIKSDNLQERINEIYIMMMERNFGEFD